MRNGHEERVQEAISMFATCLREIRDPRASASRVAVAYDFAMDIEARLTACGICLAGSIGHA